MSKSNTINIFISDLAIALNVNKYKTVTSLVIKLWKNYLANDYNSTLKSIETNKNIKIDNYKDDMDYVKNMFNKSSKSSKLNKKIEKCLKSDTTTSMKKKREELIKELDTDTNLTVDEKKELKKKLTSATNKNLGTTQECVGIDRYNEMMETTVTDAQRFVKMKLMEYETNSKTKSNETSVTKWYLCGKIDGIDGDILIEVKNRMNRLFQEMKDYERPQVQAYMNLLGLSKCHLVECLRKKKETSIFIVEEDYDQEYWSEFVMPALLSFIKMFHICMKDNKIKELLLTLNEEDCDKFLVKLIHENINRSVSEDTNKKQTTIRVKKIKK
jgi:hypothetical protein